MSSEWTDLIKAGFAQDGPPVTEEEEAAIEATLGVYMDVEGEITEIGISAAKEMKAHMEMLKQGNGEGWEVTPLKESLKKILEYFNKNFIMLFPSMNVFKVREFREYFAKESKTMLIATLESKKFHGETCSDEEKDAMSKYSDEEKGIASQCADRLKEILKYSKKLDEIERVRAALEAKIQQEREEADRKKFDEQMEKLKEAESKRLGEELQRAFEQERKAKGKGGGNPKGLGKGAKEAKFNFDPKSDSWERVWEKSEGQASVFEGLADITIGLMEKHGCENLLEIAFKAGVSAAGFQTTDSGAPISFVHQHTQEEITFQGEDA